MHTTRCTPMWLVAAVLAGLTGMQQSAHADYPVKMKTIQSLADGSRGLYLAVDDATGAITVKPESDISTSGTWWELDDSYFEVHRSYRTHRVRNRGNNAVNGRSLVSNADGTLGFSESDVLDASQRWIVRYAGLYRGYHAFFIQNSEMEFLTLEGGEVKIGRPYSTGVYWHITAGPSLPTDQIK